MSTAAALHPNSLAAYAGAQAEFSQREKDILFVLSDGKPRTDRQVMKLLGFCERNSVAPRITHLIQTGALIEAGETICEVTGKTVRLIRKRRHEAQGVLF